MQCVWVMVLLLPAALSQRFKVVGSDSSVVGVSGSGVVLPCSVRGLDGQTSVNAEDMTVTWSRLDLSDSVVHQYGNHKDLNTDQISQYRGRTSVFEEELQRGNISLSLSNIRLTDEGRYSCTVDSESWKTSGTVHLTVEAVGSQPVITVESYDSETVSLLCKSEGWYPEPALQWMNSRGDNLTAEEIETQRVADLSYSVKRRMTVKHSDIDTFSCRVTQRDSEGYITAAAIYDHLPNPLRTAVIVVGVILSLVLLTVGAVYLCRGRRRWKQRREVRSYLISDGDDRLLHHDLSPLQWDHVESTLLNTKEELKEFRLKKYVPTDRGVQKLQRVIASSTTALLNDCSLSEKSCSVLASVLRSVNSLKDLNLNKNNLEDSGVKKLSDGLKSEHCKLETLSLEKCVLTKGSCSVLASVLRSVNSLKDLNLSYNKLLDSGVKELSEGLKSEHCKLETLRLSYCVITDTGCAALTSALTENPSSALTQLDLNGNQIGESELKKKISQLKQTFPHLTVNADS
ncbi:butyrophilin-like protein 9 isoform X2 [Salminus brasiliensis]|uniref:butyrophilin-like protein 9 isoform X2 n=1 Tax=Salminus brasiliensis TaxID=930266 RepID=UPI003B82CE75